MKYISIADCRLCKNIPQKSEEDLKSPDKNQKIPKEVQEFTTVTTVESDPHRYAKSIDKLLKCPLCGTYYYYNHYDDDGEFFMDSTSDDIEVRRYDPLSALNYLESIARGAGENVPKPFGQLKKAFLDNVTPESAITGEALGKEAGTAKAELRDLRRRYPSIIADLQKVLNKGAPNWHIQKYCIEALCNNFLIEEKSKEIHELLFAHKNVVVKVESARYILGIGTGDAPVVELIHKSRSLTAAVEKYVSKNMGMLVHVFYDAAIAPEAETQEYDWIGGWYKSNSRLKALYGLEVAASHGADIAFAIPGIARLLSKKDVWTNSRVCRVFESFIDQRKKGYKRIVMDAIHGFAKEKPGILSNPEVQKIITKGARKTVRSK